LLIDGHNKLPHVTSKCISTISNLNDKGKHETKSEITV